MKALIMVLSFALLAACATVPYTQRKQFNTYSEAAEDEMGLQAYQQVKAEAKLSSDPEANAMLKRVGQRLAGVAERPDYKWEFILIDDPKTLNAFCLPGGRVAFYTGILPVTKDENGMAVVMSHEIAHALARHGGERMTQATIVNGLQGVAAEAGWIKSPQAMQLVNLAYGVGIGLPHGRAQESEADRIGLILMAKAGYDPRGAIDFWQRMKAAKGSGSAPPEWLSTHPSDETRIKRIQEQLPEALTYLKS